MTLTDQCIEIDTLPEFRFAEQVAFLRLAPLDCLYTVAANAIYKAIRVSRGPAILKVSATAADKLAVMYSGPAGEGLLAETVKQYVVEWFNLDTNISPFYTMAKTDRLLAPLAEQYRGLYIVGIPDLFEAIAWAIIGQQINLTFAYQLKRRFTQSFGEQFTSEGRQYWLFPLPEVVAGLQVGDFLPLQFSRQKAVYLIGAAQAIMSNQLSKEKLLQEPGLSAMKSRLMNLKGVGEWTADYVLLKCLRQLTAFPVGDAGLQNAVKSGLAMAKKPTATELQHLAEPWQGWEAYATFYLWRSLYT